MKKTIIALTVCLLLLTILNQTGRVMGSQPKAAVNKVALYLDSKKLDTVTVMYQDMLYAPLKDLCLYTSAGYQTGESNSRINISTGEKNTGKSAPDTAKRLTNIKTAGMAFGKYSIAVDGVNYYLENFEYDGIVYVPVRYFLEIFKRDISWDNQTKSVQVKLSDTVVGTVNGEKLTKRELDYVFKPKSKSMNISDEAQLKKLKQEILDSVIRKKILKQKVSENHVSLEAEDLTEINSRISAIVNNQGGIQNFRKTLMEYGAYFSEVIQFFSNEILINKRLPQKMTEDKGPGDEEMKQYYEAHKNGPDFIKSEMIRVKYIFINTMDRNYHPLGDEDQRKASTKALEALEKIKSGGDFDHLITEYSEDPNFKSYPNGYTLNMGQMPPEFEQVAFSMKPGEISGLIETKVGYYLIKLEEKIPERPFTFEEAQSIIFSRLDNGRREKYFTDLVDRWKAVSKVEILRQW
jgi:parvulin-like peptidyl-prolyl isomerase